MKKISEKKELIETLAKAMHEKFFEKEGVPAIFDKTRFESLAELAVEIVRKTIVSPEMKAAGAEKMGGNHDLAHDMIDHVLNASALGRH